MKYCQRKPPSFWDLCRNLMANVEVELNGTRGHFAFSGRCNATFGEVSDLLNSNAVFSSDRDRLDFCKLLYMKLSTLGENIGLRMKS
jgi:hypothetical protein